VVDNTGTLFIGVAGKSFTLPYADAHQIIGLLPGGGDVSVLAGDYTYNTVPKKTKSNQKWFISADHNFRIEP